MRTVFSILHRTLLLITSSWIIWICIHRLGPMIGILTWTLSMLGLCILSGILLRTSPVGQITWRNRLSGYLIPWGHSLRWGRLIPIVLTSWIIWILIGIAIWILTRNQPLRESTPNLPPIDWVRILIFVSWVLFMTWIIYLIGNIKQNFSITSKSGRSLMIMILIMCLLLSSSVIAVISGQPIQALLMTGLPIVIVGGFGSIFVIAATLLIRKNGHH